MLAASRSAMPLATASVAPTDARKFVVQPFDRERLLSKVADALSRPSERPDRPPDLGARSGSDRTAVHQEQVTRGGWSHRNRTVEDLRHALVTSHYPAAPPPKGRLPGAGMSAFRVASTNA